MILSAANQQHRKRANLHRFFRRDFVGIEPSISANRIQGRNGRRTKNGFTQQWTKFEPGIVVSNFAKAGEGIFRGYRLNSRLDRSGLQRNRGAHRYAQRVQMPHALARVQRIDNRSGVVALEPSVRRHRAAALPMRAGVHHHQAISVAQQKFRVSQIPGAIIGNAVVQQHPVSICMRRKNFPAPQNRAVRSAHLEILFRRIRARKRLVRLVAPIGI